MRSFLQCHTISSRLDLNILLSTLFSDTLSLLLFSAYNYDSRRHVLKWNIITLEFLETLHLISNFMTIICVL
jgi:hypothetical protein